MFHLAGKGPISRQVEQKMRHLTGERLLSGVMTEVRGDGGEKGERVSRAFFCPRKLSPFSRQGLTKGIQPKPTPSGSERQALAARS